MNFILPDLTSARLRVGMLVFLCFALFTVLAIQLFTMQVGRRVEYTEKARRQSARTIRIPAVRGRILFRDGTPLTDNRVSYDVKLHLSDLRARNRKETMNNILAAARAVAKNIGRENTLTVEAVSRHLNFFPGIPIDLFSDLNESELGRLWEIAPSIPGLEIAAEPVRSYPAGPLAAQLTGYVGPADPLRADDRAEYFYYIADPEGKAGLELLYDEKLRGTAGSRLVLVNSAGLVHEQLESESSDARNGLDLALTLDRKAQQIAEDLLRGQRGALVLMNAENGEILAMASSPTFNPGDFIPRITSEKYNAVNKNPDHPFLNRAVQGCYMPGSIIKPLTGLAVLQAGVDPAETVDCRGKAPFGYGNGIKCLSQYGHGPLDLREAIKRSCNVYFITNGMRIGIDALSHMFESAGIGSKTGFELPERTGYLPRNSPSWPEQETAYVAFGQGRIEVTPLQAAVFTAAIANGGTRWKPILVRHILDTSNPGAPVSVYDAVPEAAGRLDASPESLAVVQEGMRMVVQDSGSGARAKNSKIELSGKTGTADVVTKKETFKNVWFVGFGRDPKTNILYSIAIVIEHGESGGRTAAPIARDFFEHWL